MFRLTDTGKQRNAEYHKGYVLLFLLVTCKSRCAGLCFYANGWVSSRQPMSQPQPLKPHGVAGHSSVPALGVRTQGSASSLCRGGTYLGALLGLAAILGCRGWGAHLVFQAARRWVGPSPLALHLGNGTPFASAAVACRANSLTPNLYCFCFLKNSHGAWMILSPSAPTFPST